MMRYEKKKISAGRKNIRELRKFIGEIKSLTAGRDWKISLTEVLDYFMIAREDYYRYIYEKSELDFDEFNGHNIMSLMSLLHDSGVRGVFENFSSAGYYFSPDLLIEFQELFQSVSMNRLQNLKVDRDLLETSISGCTDTADAISFYCDAVLDLNELVNFSVNLYLKRISAEEHAVSRGILRDHIEIQFKYGAMKLDDLLSGLKQKLKESAVLWKMIPPEALFTGNASGEMLEALRILEFSGSGIPDAKSLKLRYYELIKKYHPDVNPDGLEITRKINSAYAMILNYNSERKAG